MDAKTFNTIVDTQIQKSVDLLLNKNESYNPDADKLSSFRSAALLGKSNLREALSGMMIKHTVSLYDMLNSGKQYPEAVWEEKIMDHINYLLLARAVIEDDHAISEPPAAALAALKDKLTADNPVSIAGVAPALSVGTPTSGPSATIAPGVTVKN